MLANLILEGLALCLILTVMCIVGIKDGAAGMAFFYVKAVQDKAIAQGLTTAEKIKRSAKIFKVSGILIYVAALMVSVYAINGARGFLDAFLQMLVIFAVLGLYDRFFVDIFWVGHTKAWIIPGTEEFMPYIPFKIHVKKWIAMLVVYPAGSAMIALVMSFVLK